MAHGQAAPLNFDGVDVAHAFPTSNFLDHLKKRNMFIGEYIKKNPTGPLPSGNHVVTNQRVPLPPELSVTRNRHNSNLKRAFQIGLNLETQSGRALGLWGRAALQRVLGFFDLAEPLPILGDAIPQTRLFSRGSRVS